MKVPAKNYLVLAFYILLSGCTSLKHAPKLEDDKAYNSSFSYISATDSGGVCPLFKPVKIMVDGKTIAEGDPIPNMYFYPIKPGLHKVVIKYVGSDWCAAFLGDSIMKTEYNKDTVDVKPGSFYGVLATGKAFKPKKEFSHLDTIIHLGDSDVVELKRDVILNTLKQ